MSRPTEAFVRELQGARSAGVLEAAQKLLDSGADLEGAPPPEFVAVLMATDSGIEPPLLNLVRAWERTAMSRAVLDALDSTKFDDVEQAAWLLKTVLAVEHAREAIERILDSRDNPNVRHWLIEGLERLALGEGLGWTELQPLVQGLSFTQEPALKVGLAGLLGALPWRDESAAILSPMLDDGHPEVISAAAHILARHPEAVRQLPPATLDRLQRASNPIVGASAAVLIRAIRD